ncbi:unnamed protein product [Toxocara canis]|uniref:Ty3-gypsy retrotransposon protein n=1 Tax=Toxocara canis TaxID=6265 RepID=A0A183VCM3_TOXCA|nr:unnamed protein product [Toxocara canis]
MAPTKIADPIISRWQNFVVQSQEVLMMEINMDPAFLVRNVKLPRFRPSSEGIEINLKNVETESRVSQKAHDDLHYVPC